MTQTKFSMAFCLEYLCCQDPDSGVWIMFKWVQIVFRCLELPISFIFSSYVRILH